jgi:RimJ/RimL family protein N-acetyltransferase
MAILETDRLTLREFTIDDAEFIMKLLNSPGWLKYVGTRNIKTQQDAVSYINDKMISGYVKNGFGFYAVVIKEDNTCIGMCGLTKRENLDDADIGFALLPEYEGKGYAFESAAAVMDYARNVLKLGKISAITVAPNKNSIRLLEKIGLVFEKTLKLSDDPEELMLFVKSF